MRNEGPLNSARILASCMFDQGWDFKHVNSVKFWAEACRRGVQAKIVLISIEPFLVAAKFVGLLKVTPGLLSAHPL